MESCNWSIEKLPGLGEEDFLQLKNCGIATTQELLQKANQPEAQEAIAKQLNLNINYVKKWVALADLARIPSVGCEFCGVLLHSGVGSTSQLAQITVYRLHRQILKMQVATLQRRDLCPSVNEVQQWIQQAQTLTGRR